MLRSSSEGRRLDESVMSPCNGVAKDPVDEDTGIDQGEV